MGKAKLVGQVSTNYFEDWQGLDPSTTYYYQIVAIKEGEYILTGSVAATTSANLPPSETNQIASPSPTSELATPLDVPLITLQAEGVNDSEVLLSWTAPKIAYAGGSGWIDMSSDGGTTWHQINPSSDWGAYQDSGEFPIQSNAFLVRKLDRYVNYQFRLHYEVWDNLGAVQSYTTTPATAQVRIPEHNNVIYLIDGHQHPLQWSLSTNNLSGKLSGVEAIWRKLIDDGYNAYLSPEPDWQGSVFKLSTLGNTTYIQPDSFGYQEIQQEVSRGMTNIALIGYSHGGGTIYDLAAQIVRDHVIPIYQSNNIVFAGTIDAVVRDDTDRSRQPLATAPGGAASGDINYYQLTPFLRGWVPAWLENVHGTNMPDAAYNSQLPTITYRDSTGVSHTIPAAHTNIFYDDALISDMIRRTENRLRSLSNY